MSGLGDEQLGSADARVRGRGKWYPANWRERVIWDVVAAALIGFVIFGLDSCDEHRRARAADAREETRTIENRRLESLRWVLGQSRSAVRDEPVAFNQNARRPYMYLDLHGMRLPAVDLTNTNFEFADLTDVDFFWADLRHADLREAKLDGARLVAVKLQGALLTQTHFGNADLSGSPNGEGENTDLTGATGLTCEQLRHVRYNNFTIWPSNVGPPGRNGCPN